MNDVRRDYFDKTFPTTFTMSHRAANDWLYLVLASGSERRPKQQPLPTVYALTPAHTPTCVASHSHVTATHWLPLLPLLTIANDPGRSGADCRAGGRWAKPELALLQPFSLQVCDTQTAINRCAPNMRHAARYVIFKCNYTICTDSIGTLGYIWR